MYCVLLIRVCFYSCLFALLVSFDDRKHSCGHACCPIDGRDTIFVVCSYPGQICCLQIHMDMRRLFWYWAGLSSCAHCWPPWARYMCTCVSRSGSYHVRRVLEAPSGDVTYPRRCSTHCSWFCLALPDGVAVYLMH